MALPLDQNASIEDLEFELSVIEIQISSLDQGADEYHARLRDLEIQKNAIELRIEQLDATQTETNASTAHDQVPAQTMNGTYRANNPPQPYNNAYLSPNHLKRRLPEPSLHDDYRSYKRATPEPSSASSPASSSTDSFVLVERPGTTTDRALQHQRDAEAQMLRRRETLSSDEQYARMLQQQHHTSHPSSSRLPSLQTTLNHNASSYAKPPPPPAAPSSFASPPSAAGRSSQQPPQQHIKAEPVYGRPQQLPQRPRTQPAEVVDLTGLSDDEDALTEIAPAGFTPNNRSYTQRPSPAPFSANHGAGVASSNAGNFQSYHSGAAVPRPYSHAPYPQPTQPFPQMPGSFPDPNANQYVHGNPGMPMAQENNYASPNMMFSTTMNGIRSLAQSLGNPLTELNNLVNGSQQTYGHPSLDSGDDDDLIFGGSRPRQPGPAPYAGYEDHDLYNRRFEAIQNYDPARTSEEINALLENIRPDEEMPAHLRVTTPEAMTIKLHKYQELGLTWLQNCEAGSNKGGILADDSEFFPQLKGNLITVLTFFPNTSGSRQDDTNAQSARDTQIRRSPPQDYLDRRAGSVDAAVAAGD
jgi:hypothetical protein